MARFCFYDSINLSIISSSTCDNASRIPIRSANIFIEFTSAESSVIKTKRFQIKWHAQTTEFQVGTKNENEEFQRQKYAIE